MTRIVVCLVTIMLLSPLVSEAGRLEVTATKYKAIKNPDVKNEAHFLLQFHLPRSIQGKKIEAAYFDWSILLDSVNEDSPWVHVVVYELARDWDVNTVSWKEPWELAGGDRREGERSASLLVPGRGNARFEVTKTVQAWADGSRENHGMLIAVKGRKVPLPAIQQRTEGGEIGPLLRIWYTDSR